MRRTLLAAVVCLAGFVAGCGSSSKTPTTPAAPATSPSTSGTGTGPSTTSMSSMVHSGTSGTMGPPSSGTTYSFSNHTVIQHLANALGQILVGKGFTNVRVDCREQTTTQAACKASGTAPDGRSSTATLTVDLNPQTGHFTIVHIS